MAENQRQKSGAHEAKAQEPSGFTTHSGGLSSEYAREQGWGLNEEERTKTDIHKQDADGGTDYEYGARDFGDSAVDTSAAVPKESVKEGDGKGKVGGKRRGRVER